MSANQSKRIISQKKKQANALEKNKKQADFLMSQGYLKTSNRHCMLSRIDRSDWMEKMAKSHAPWNIEEGRAWVEGLGVGSAADHYRRCYSNDNITVTPEVLKFVKSSGHNPTGFLPKKKVA